MDNLDYLIDRKIKGSITASEADQLEQLILHQPDIRIEIENRLEISKAIQYAGNEELRKSLKQIHKEEFPLNGTSKIINLKSILSIAAIFILGIAGYMFLMHNQNNDISGEQAYATYYTPYKATFQSRGETSNLVYDNFKNDYSNARYIDALKQIPKDSDLNDITDNEVLLTLGISSIEADNLVMAKTYFNLIIERDDYFFKDHAKWYLALTYLKEDKIVKAKAILKELGNNNQADHNQEATKLLAKLK